MSLVYGVYLYLTIALSLGLTSYINLFRPSISYAEEILDEELPYNGLFGLIIWVALATLFAPFTALLLLANNNTGIIKDLAVKFAKKHLEEDEE